MLLAIFIVGCSRGTGVETERFLSTPSTALSLGDVWIGETRSVDLPIVNQHCEAVQITRVSASCDCVSVHPLAFDLAPGEEQIVTLTIDVPGTMEAESFEAVDELMRFSQFQQMVRFDGMTAHGQQFRSVFVLMGRVAAPIVFLPSQITIGFESEDGEATICLPFESLDQELRWIVKSWSPALSQFWVERPTSQCASHRLCWVEDRWSTSPGSLAIDFQLVPTALPIEDIPGAPSAPFKTNPRAIRVAVERHGEPFVQCLPSTCFMGIVAIGTSHKFEIVLASSEREFRIVDWALNGVARNVSLTKSPGMSLRHELSIETNSDTLGPLGTSVIVYLESSDGKLGCVDIPVVGFVMSKQFAHSEVTLGEDEEP